MGCLMALSRFISRLGKKGLPLYRLLRKSKRFSWTPEAEEALTKLKALLDGSLMKTGAGTGLLFISPLGVHLRYMIRLHFAASNNAAEYEV